MAAFSENDIYVVKSDFLIGDTDTKVLTFLYQPLVGVESVGLYSTFMNEIGHYKFLSNKNCISRLTKTLKTSFENLEEWVKRLEAVGLLKTYFKKIKGINHFVFELQPALCPKSFLEHELLGSFLRSEVGEEDFRVIAELFHKKRMDKREFEDLTHSFDDVYGSYNPEKIIFKKDAMFLGERSSSAQTQLKKPFDEKTFTYLLGKSELLVPEKLITPDLIEFAKNLAFVYNYSEEVLAGMISDSYEPEQGVDYAKARQLARTSYYLKKSSNGPKIIDKRIVHSSKHAQLSDLERKFVEMTPREKLKEYFNGGEPPAIDLKVLEEILSDIKLVPEVLNVLIDYVMIVNKRKFSRPFVSKIAAEWKRLGIVTVKQAMDQAKREHESKREYERKREEQLKREKGEEKPNWVKKEDDENSLSDEEFLKEQEEINRMLEED